VGLAVADVNADGTLELLMGGNSDIGFTAVENNDAGTFSAILQSGLVAGTTALAVGDFNNDGSIDVALASSGSNTISVMLQSPSVTLSTASMNFGNVQVGGSGTQSITVTNSGSALLQIGNLSAGGAFSQTNDCPATIVPGNACAITVAYSPTAAGTQAGVLTIADNAPGGPQTVNLTGVGATFTVSIGLTLNTVVGGNVLPANKVGVSSPAPPGGWTVNLSSSNPAVAAVPASVAVAAGATVSSSFIVSTSGVSSSTPVTITASVNGATAAVVLTVNPIGVSFGLAATAVNGGSPITPNNLILANPAPTGGLVFNLSSSNPAFASVPASVTVAAGATVSSSFSINTAAVRSTTTATIFAGLSRVNGAIASALLTLNVAARWSCRPPVSPAGYPPLQMS
jgi:hypothetical protein